MNNAQMRWFVLPVLSLAIVSGNATASDYAAEYSWAFASGNLVSNWSFENLGFEIDPVPATGGMSLQPRAKSFGGLAAKTGSFFAVVNTDNDGTAVADPIDGKKRARSQLSQALRCEPNTEYAFSVAFSEPSRVGNVWPVIIVQEEDGQTEVARFIGVPYSTFSPIASTAWNTYEFRFNTGSLGNKVRFILAENDAVSAGGIICFDNLVLTKGTGSKHPTEHRSYGDASGNMDQTIRSNKQSQVVLASEFDDHGRLAKALAPVYTNHKASFDFGAIKVGIKASGERMNYDFPDLPTAYSAVGSVVASMRKTEIGAVRFIFIVESPEQTIPEANIIAEIIRFQDVDGEEVDFEFDGIIKYSPEYASLDPGESVVVSTNGPIARVDIDALLLSQYPNDAIRASEFRYPNHGVDLKARSSLPGTTGYSIDGEHATQAGMAFVAGLDVPTPIELNSNETSSEAKYLYKWSKSPNGTYDLTWIDQRGLVQKRCISSKATPTADPADWLETAYSYDGFGRLEEIQPPLGGAFGTSYSYFGAKQVSSELTPDKFFTRYLYAPDEKLRFIDTEDGLENGYMLAYKYDSFHRIREFGKTARAFTQANADNPGFPQEALEVGYLYDAFDPSDFAVRTGVTLAEMGFPAGFGLSHTQGKMIGTYNLNKETEAPGFSQPSRRLVATLFDYDEKGRLRAKYTYLGSIASPPDRIQKIGYNYDQDDRLESVVVFKRFGTSDISSKSRFIYDDMGRLDRVLDANSQTIAAYEYNGLGQTVGERLGKNLDMGFSFDIRNNPVKIEAVHLPTNRSKVFSEYLGYDSKPAPFAAVPDLSPNQQRYDGRISSILDKFSGAVAAPVEARTFDYDPVGRLSGSSKLLSAGATQVLNEDGSIKESGLTFPTTQISSYAFDGDGRMSSKTVNGVGYDFEFEPQTHLLKNVTKSPQVGRLMRDNSGNFEYDGVGRLTHDKGLSKRIHYGSLNLPVSIEIGSKTIHFLYDSDGNRVAELEETMPGSVLSRRAILYQALDRVAKEITVRETSHPFGAASIVKDFLNAGEGAVGVKISGTEGSVIVSRKKYWVTNHQGSVVKSIDDGTDGYFTEYELEYSDFGEFRNLIGSSDRPDQLFTAKPFDDDERSYHFLARDYDPEAGIWLTPDPMSQFFNPYSYTGGDPINFTDPYGLEGDRNGSSRSYIGNEYIKTYPGQYRAGMGGRAQSAPKWSGQGMRGGGDVGSRSSRGSSASEATRVAGWDKAHIEAVNEADRRASLRARGLGYFLKENDVYVQVSRNPLHQFSMNVGLKIGRIEGMLIMMGPGPFLGLASGGTLPFLAGGGVRTGLAAEGAAALPAFRGAQAWSGEITSTTASQNLTMFRVWGGESSQLGSWLSPVQPASAAAARSTLALPAENAATFFSQVSVPAGTRLQIGTAAPAFGQTGGGLQVQLLQRIPAANYGPGIPLGF